MKRCQPSCAHRPMRFGTVPSLDVGQDDERNGIVAGKLDEARLYTGRKARPNTAATVVDEFLRLDAGVERV
jgi:hypothetical protein